MTHSAQRREELLRRFLLQMHTHVFVGSTDSVTGEKELLMPVVKDMEATVALSGEWDTEDLIDILQSLSDSEVEASVLEERAKTRMLIIKEVNIAHSENQPTSRLTSLYNQLFPSKQNHD